MRRPSRRKSAKMCAAFSSAGERKTLLAVTSSVFLTVFQFVGTVLRNFDAEDEREWLIRSRLRPENFES